jgi:hypothetical protein
VTGHLYLSSALVKYLGIDGFVSFDHRLDRESLFDSATARSAIDLVNPIDCGYSTRDVVDEETCYPVIDHFATGSEIVDFPSVACA